VDKVKPVAILLLKLLKLAEAGCILQGAVELPDVEALLRSSACRVAAPAPCSPPTTTTITTITTSAPSAAAPVYLWRPSTTGAAPLIHTATTAAATGARAVLAGDHTHRPCRHVRLLAVDSAC